MKAMFERIFKKRNITPPRNGKWKEFNKQAILVSEGYYVQDIKHGGWKQYYETGELLIEETYEQGILHGRYASYHLNGQLLSEGNYEHGKREGFFEVYDEDGNPVKRILFMNNVLLEEVDARKEKVHASL